MTKPILTRRGVLGSGLAASLLTDGDGSAAASGTRVGSSGAQLDPGDVQILFADLQVPLVAGSQTTSPTALARGAGVLAKVAAILHMPTLFSIVPFGGGNPPLIPELRPFATTRNTLRRRLVSPFADPPTAAALAREDRKILVIAGFATEAVVIHAALDALDAGYEVQYVVDATGGQSARTEDAAFRHMERAGAVPTSILTLTTRLAPDFFHSPGSETFAAIQPLLQH